MKYILLFLSIAYIMSCTKEAGSLTDGVSNPNDTTIIVVDTTMIGIADTIYGNPFLEYCNCPDSLTPIYIESGGLLLMEAESSLYSQSDWIIDSTQAGSFNDYLIWSGGDFFNDPGNGVLNYKIAINRPGVYRVIWRSRILQGNSNTEHNDSWLRIHDSKHFYAARASDGHIVYPKGSTQAHLPASSGQPSTTPEGSGREGWFKVYMNRLNEWQWRATTSDNDPHDIYAVFDTSGVYTLEVSGRSNGHGIDRILLFDQKYSLFEASDRDKVLSAVECR